MRSCNRMRGAAARTWLRDRAKCSVSQRLRGDKDLSADALILAEPLVVYKEKRVVLPNGSAYRSPKLIPPELRLRDGIEIISRVQGTIAQELVCSTVKLIRARLCDRVDNAARGSPVLC